MSTFMNLWLGWVYPFKALPYSDYIAAFVLVGLIVALIKTIKSFMRYV